MDTCKDIFLLMGFKKRILDLYFQVLQSKDNIFHKQYLYYLITIPIGFLYNGKVPQYSSK